MRTKMGSERYINAAPLCPWLLYRRNIDPSEQLKVTELGDVTATVYSKEHNIHDYITRCSSGAPSLTNARAYTCNNLCSRKSPPAPESGYMMVRKLFPSSIACRCPRFVNSPPHFKMSKSWVALSSPCSTVVRFPSTSPPLPASPSFLLSPEYTSFEVLGKP